MNEDIMSILLLNIKVVFGDLYGQIKIFNSTSMTMFKTFTGHTGQVYRIKQSPFTENSNHVATGSDSTVKIWDSSLNWKLIQTYTQHTSYVSALEWLDKDTLA